MKKDIAWLKESVRGLKLDGGNQRALLANKKIFKVLDLIDELDDPQEEKDSPEMIFVKALRSVGDAFTNNLESLGAEKELYKLGYKVQKINDSDDHYYRLALERGNKLLEKNKQIKQLQIEKKQLLNDLLKKGKSENYKADIQNIGETAYRFGRAEGYHEGVEAVKELFRK